jgi:hypothetical protein
VSAADPGVNLAALTALKQGTDVCDGMDATVALVGTATGTCVKALPAPTCSDGLQDGLETGVDCGGSTCTGEGLLCGKCTTDLSNTGLADFAINFDVTTTATVQSALSNQRKDCAGLATGDGFWDARMAANGTVMAQFTDGTVNVIVNTTTKINDGKQHSVTLLRANRQFTVLVDGVTPGVSVGDPGVNFGTLSALKTGTDICDGMDATVALVGTATAACVKADPTSFCQDGMLDGNETATDCGGSCNLIGNICGSCATDLSSAGYNDFAINFHVTTTATTQSALTGQRSVCGNTGPWWDARMTASGGVLAEFGNGTLLASLTSTTKINDGKTHEVTLQRVDGKFSVLIDKTLPGVSVADPGLSFPAGLPALKQGTDVCDGMDGTVALVGSVDTSCITQLVNPVPTGIWANFDARNTASITQNGSKQVTAWNDISGNAHNLVANGGDPIYGAALLNGLPALNFGNQAGMVSGATFALTNAVTVFAVVTWEPTGQTVQGWGNIAHHGSRDSDWSLEQNEFSTGDNLLDVHWQTNNDNTTDDLILAANTNWILMGRMDTTNGRAFTAFSTAGGFEQTTGAGDTIAPANQLMYVGKSNIGESMNGYIGQILYYNVSLTNVQVAEVLQYLQQSWAF